MGATSVQTRAVSSDASEDPAKHVLSWRSTNTQRSSRARENPRVMSYSHTRGPGTGPGMGGFDRKF